MSSESVTSLRSCLRVKTFPFGCEFSRREAESGTRLYFWGCEGVKTLVSQETEKKNMLFSFFVILLF